MQLSSPSENSMPEKAQKTGPNLKGLVITLVTAFIIGAIAYGLASVVVTYEFKQLVASGSNITLEEFSRDLIKNSRVISISTILTAISGTALIFLFLKIRKINARAYLKLNSAGALVHLKWLGVLLFVMLVTGLMTNMMGKSSESAKFAMDLFRNPQYFWLLVVAVSLAAPIFEELLIRGYLLEGLKDTILGPVGAVIVSSLVWTFLHLQYNWYNLAIIAILGLVLGYAKLKTNSLYVPILMHIVHNSIAVIAVLYYLQQEAIPV